MFGERSTTQIVCPVMLSLFKLEWYSTSWPLEDYTREECEGQIFNEYTASNSVHFQVSHLLLSPVEALSAIQSDSTTEFKLRLRNIGFCSPNFRVD